MTERTFATIRRSNDAFDPHDVNAIMALRAEECVFDDTRPPASAAWSGGGLHCG